MQITANHRRTALRAFMDREGLKTRTWEEAAGMNGTLRKFLEGKSKTMNDATYIRLAEAAFKFCGRPVTTTELQVSQKPVELRLTYEGDRDSDVRQLDHHPQVSHSGEKENTLKVFESSPGGDAGGFLMERVSVHRVGKPTRIAERDDVFAFHVVTNDMAEKFRPGDMVIVEQHRAPRETDYVLVEMKSEPPALRPMLLKKLITAGADKITLAQLKPPKEFDVDRKKIERIYRVMEIVDLV